MKIIQYNNLEKLFSSSEENNPHFKLVLNEFHEN